MPLTFGLTGMDPATESSLKTAFTEANARGGNRWQLLPESEADFVVVDMDSMYGPMSWLRLHAADKRVIGLTSVARTQTDFRLERPFDSTSVAALLQELAGAASGAAVGSEPASQAPLASEHPSPSPAGMTPAPQRQDLLPEELPPVIGEEISAPALASVAASVEAVVALDPREPPSAAAGQIVPAAPTLQPHVPAQPVAAIAPAIPVEPRTLAEWLLSGRLGGHLRFVRGGTPLLIDAVQRHFHGPATLKALAEHFAGAVTLADFAPLDEATWASQSAALGEAQPLSRLVWFGGLLAGKGSLTEGYDPESRYRLLKWPQTEREFPRHFRIATAMMKGPATLTEIGEASGVPLTDVTDFVNASLATRFAEPYVEPEPEVEPPKSGGLFGRLRGR